MPAYVIAQLAVTGAAGFEACRKAADPVVKAFAGRFLVRGGAVIVVEGGV